MKKSHRGSLPTNPKASAMVGEAVGVYIRPFWQISTSAIFLDMFKKFAELTGAWGWPRTAGDCRRLSCAPSRCIFTITQDGCTLTILTLIANDHALVGTGLYFHENQYHNWLFFSTESRVVIFNAVQCSSMAMKKLPWTLVPALKHWGVKEME